MFSQKQQKNCLLFFLKIVKSSETEQSEGKRSFKIFFSPFSPSQTGCHGTQHNDTQQRLLYVTLSIRDTQHK
jgi:hypothetical protein